MKRESWAHPKLKLAARDLGISLCHMRGVMGSIWMFTSMSFPRGDIGRMSNEEIAVAIDYDRDPEELVRVLVARRLLDEHAECRLYVHDFSEHADDTVHYKLARAGLSFMDGAKSRRVRDGLQRKSTVGDSRRQRIRVGDRPPTPTPTTTPTTTNTERSSVARVGRKRRGRTDVPEGFEDFYQAYPRKKARPAAESAWRKLNPNPDLRAKIMDALELVKASHEWRKDRGRFVPYPATFLNGDRWEDQIDPEPSGSAEVGGYGRNEFWECEICGSAHNCPPQEFHRGAA